MSFCVTELQSSSCGNPGVPPKGVLYGTKFDVGDKIRYSCVAGYILDGHPQLTCIANSVNTASWDFPVPICRGKNNTHTCTYIQNLFGSLFNIMKHFKSKKLLSITIYHLHIIHLYNIPVCTFYHLFIYIRYWILNMQTYLIFATTKVFLK